jgi:hypothetical protein
MEGRHVSASYVEGRERSVEPCNERTRMLCPGSRRVEEEGCSGRSGEERD